MPTATEMPPTFDFGKRGLIGEVVTNIDRPLS
jgi:hypothetical protein